MSACMNTQANISLGNSSNVKDSLIKRTVEIINEFAQSDHWVGVHIIIAQCEPMLAESEDPYVLELLARMKAELAAGRAERESLESGLILPTDGSAVWLCPEGIKVPDQKFGPSDPPDSASLELCGPVFNQALTLA